MDVHGIKGENDQNGNFIKEKLLNGQVLSWFSKAMSFDKTKTTHDQDFLNVFFINVSEKCGDIT